MPLDASELLGRFSRAWLRLGATSDVNTVFADLVRRHGEPQRHYHTLEHVAHCLQELDRVAALRRATRRAVDADALAAIEIALWFHDAVYDPRRTDNEEKSADLFRETAAGIGSDTRRLIGAMIRSTKDHGPSDVDAFRILADCDLAILGQPPDVFDAYERAIRAEYVGNRVVDEAVYREKRSGVLRHFLEMPRIYQTDEMHALLDRPARDNLKRALKALA